jgi:hypothetical protein
MSDHHKFSGVDRVMWALDLNAENPRKAFEEEFGLKPNDRKIDEELELALKTALRFDPPRKTASVPLYLLAALVLRRRRGHPKPLSLRKRREQGRMLANLRAKARKRKSGETAIDALHRVAEEGAEKLGWSFETVKRRLASSPRRR